MTIKAIVFDAYGTLYDVQSVAGEMEAAFPGRGDPLTQIWRMKQLEYSWFRSMMGRYESFWTITREALAYSLGVLGLAAETALFDRIAERYNHLDPYPEARAALQSLARYRLAILSNGSPDMLQALVRNTGFGDLIEAVISVDDKKVYKPDPRAYQLVEERLAVPPDEVLFVSSNGFDVAGAKAFGFTVARIERVSREALRGELSDATKVGPSGTYKALRSQPENIGFPADFTIHTLSELATAVLSAPSDRRS